MKILITGAAGPAGLNMFAYFYKKGHEITGVFDPNTADYIEAAKVLYEKYGMKLLDFSDNTWDRRQTITDVDWIINEEALISAPDSVQNPLRFHQINVTTFLGLLEVVRMIGAKPRIICASSNISYGEPIYKPIDETHPQNPNSPYGATRAAAEKYAIAYYHTYDIPITILRYSNLYGTFGYGVINQFIKDAKEKGIIKITGDGSQTRTYTYMKDAAMGTELALTKKRAIGKTYNIAGPETANLMEIAEIIKKFFPNLKIEKTSNWKGDILSGKYAVSHALAFEELGYKPKYSLEKGIRELIKSEM